MLKQDTDWLELLIGQPEPGLLRTLRHEDVQVFFEVGDRVRFAAGDGGTITGTVDKLNPKRASVRCDADYWTVPYAGLEHLCESTAMERQPRAARLREVAVQARGLMDHHGLAAWALHFNVARGKLGECRSRQKLILLSRSHAVDGPPEQVTDTILHEIAHALAGPAAGHGPAWKAIARRIGATPSSRVPESDEGRRHLEDAKQKFRRGDPVSFTARGEHWTGTIVRMNPKRARIQCGEVVWMVPYANLDVPPGTDSGSGSR